MWYTIIVLPVVSWLSVKSLRLKKYDDEYPFLRYQLWTCKSSFLIFSQAYNQHIHVKLSMRDCFTKRKQEIPAIDLESDHVLF